MKPILILAALLALILVGTYIWVASTPPRSEPVVVENNVATTSESAFLTQEEKAKRYPKAIDISTPDAFINTDGNEISIKQFEGEKVVLVNFWTYSCINCKRTLGHINSWYEELEDEGLEIIGIHTPEFAFEHKLENVQQAVLDEMIKYPVVLDNDYSTWRSYKNRYWPRRYLVDIDGYIIYDHIGEGKYEETREKIKEALKEREERLSKTVLQ